MAGERLSIIIPLLEDMEGWSVDELDDHILLLETARHRLEVEWCETIGVFEERAGHVVFGFPSLVAYLKGRARMAGSRAHRYVLMARAARRFQATFTAWRHGHVTSDQAELLFQVSQQLPDKYPVAEPVLLEMTGGSVEETRRMLDYWRQGVDRPGVEVEAQMMRRRLDYRRRNGMIEGEFALTESAGEMLITALDALLPPPDAGDDRTPCQRRHDAFQDLTRCYLDGGPTPEVGGEHPHINVMVDIDALKGIPGGLHQTETGHVLDVETIRQLACDSTISRIIWKGTSEILDVGRRTRIIPAALRRAVIARDRHCVWKDCSRSPRWSDIHHLQSWADGGETSLHNLCLLCRYHHTLTHQHQGDPTEILDLHKNEPAVSGRTS